MDRLWAPWRLDYIAGSVDADDPGPQSDENGCVFCRIIRDSNDEQNRVLKRGTTCFAILNVYPYSNGHLMIVPYRHIDHPGLLTNDESGELMRMSSIFTRILDRVYHPDGYNIGMNVGRAAGAGIAGHLHLHVVPRWSGDTNFMPVIGGVKILPELLEQTYRKLSADWDDEWKKE